MKQIQFAPANQLELESLADWLATSDVLRRDVTAIYSGAVARGKPAFGDSKAGRGPNGRFERRHYTTMFKEWQRRLRALAKAQGLSEHDQVEQVIRRAIALVELHRRGI